MMKRVAMSVFLMLACFSFSAHADNLYMSGSELYGKCTSHRVDDISSCDAYLLGVLDGRIAYMRERAEVEGKSPPLGICIYQNKMASISGLRAAVIDQISKNNEQYDDYVAGNAVVDAIKNKFPCEGVGGGDGVIKK